MSHPMTPRPEQREVEPMKLPDSGREAISGVIHGGWCDYSECEKCKSFEFTPACIRLETCFDALHGVTLKPGASVRELIQALKGFEREADCYCDDIHGMCLRCQAYKALAGFVVEP